MNVLPSADRKQKIDYGNADYAEAAPIPLEQFGLEAKVPITRSYNGVQLVFDQELHPEPYLRNIETLMVNCCLEYPGISLNDEVLGGIPHLKGTRIPVGQLIGRLLALESIQGVVDYYRGRISSDQIKEALAYAQDFIETACEPSEDHG